MRDILTVIVSQPRVPFWLAVKRMRHLRKGHTGKATLVEKLRSEKHPHSDTDWVYTVNLMKCDDCGLFFQDSGVERRKPLLGCPVAAQ